MVKVENYPNAYKEVYVILQQLNSEDFKAIPDSFVKMIEKNMNPNYSFELDVEKSLEEQELLQETRVILAYIFLNYWSTEEQKIRIKQKFRNDILIEERNKAKYNPNELFNREEQKNVQPEAQKTENTQIVQYKQNIFSRLLHKIKNLFSKKK